MSDTQQSEIVITGGSGGLARTIANRFTEGGWHVLAPGRDELDVTDTTTVARYFADHQPTLLICNAGVIRDAPLARIASADWQHVIGVNFHGARRCATTALPEMIRKKSGHIIFISSHSALHPPVGQAAYAAAKAALLGLTRALAAETGSYGVRVNAILPGFLETPMTANISARRRDAVCAAHTLGRFNTPTAVARFIWHLHPDLPHTSAQTFQLDSRAG